MRLTQQDIMISGENIRVLEAERTVKESPHKNNTKNRENGQDLKIRSEDDQRKRIQTRKIPRDEESKQERFR